MLGLSIQGILCFGMPALKNNRLLKICL